MTTFVAVAFAVWALMIFALLMTRTRATIGFLFSVALAFWVGLVLGTHAPTAAWVWFNVLGLYAVAAPVIVIYDDWRRMKRRGA